MHDAGPAPPNGGLAAQVPASLPEKYGRSINPTEFLQIYSTSKLVVGGNEAVMANYFLVALTVTT
jgi:hypothetical protein